MFWVALSAFIMSLTGEGDDTFVIRTFLERARESVSEHVHDLVRQRQALETLERTQPALYRNICDETGAVRRHLNVFVNTENIRDLNGIDSVLAAGDVVTMLPAVSGG